MWSGHSCPLPLTLTLPLPLPLLLLSCHPERSLRPRSADENAVEEPALSEAEGTPTLHPRLRQFREFSHGRPSPPPPRPSRTDATSSGSPVPRPSPIVPFAFPRPTIYKGRVREESRGQCRRILFHGAQNPTFRKRPTRQAYNFYPHRKAAPHPTPVIPTLHEPSEARRAQGGICCCP
jgi:hypothetical protein